MKQTNQDIEDNRCYTNVNLSFEARKNSVLEAKTILKKYHQEHLLDFYNDLPDNKKQAFIDQILHIDFEHIFSLYEASKKDEIIPNNVIEPLPYTIKESLNKSEKNRLEGIGKKAIRHKEYAVVTLAGGQRYKTWL